MTYAIPLRCYFNCRDHLPRHPRANSADRIASAILGRMSRRSFSGLVLLSFAVCTRI